MPNHVTHHVTATGPAADIDAFCARCFSPDERGTMRVDFNAVIPMPPGLGVAHTSDAMLGYAVFHGPDSSSRMYDDLCLNYWIEMPWLEANTREEAQAWVRANRPGAEQAGAAIKVNIDRFGFASWYGWAIEKWGTKWNGYSYRPESREPGRVSFWFATAWSPPRPVFQVWASLFPLVRFEVDSYDEGGNFACTGTLGVDYREIECGPEAYRRAYGHDRPTDEDE